MSNNNLSKQHKIAAGVLVIFGVFVIVMWIAQFKQNISAPFVYRGGENVEKNKQCDGPECTDNSEKSLRTKDSDKDGLSDWDELNIHNTSPYLEDSDSDNLSDKEEIDAESDPNCPVGKDCYGSQEDFLQKSTSTNLNFSATQNFSTTTQNITENNLLNQLNNLNNLENLNFTQQEGGKNQNLQNILQGSSDPSSLRKMLLESGMSKELLDKISDEDLMKSYEEVQNNPTL